jgi:C-terminal processing protease CtpA/Prc
LPNEIADAAIEYRTQVPKGKTGLLLMVRGGDVIVGAVIPGSPAAEAGVPGGGIIVDIGGIAPADLLEAAELMAGPPGTSVTVRIRTGRSATSYVLRRQE